MVVIQPRQAYNLFKVTQSQQAIPQQQFNKALNEQKFSVYDDDVGQLLKYPSVLDFLSYITPSYVRMIGNSPRSTDYKFVDSNDVQLFQFSTNRKIFINPNKKQIKRTGQGDLVRVMNAAIKTVQSISIQRYNMYILSLLEQTKQVMTPSAMVYRLFFYAKNYLFDTIQQDPGEQLQQKTPFNDTMILMQINGAQQKLFRKEDLFNTSIASPMNDGFFIDKNILAKSIQTKQLQQQIKQFNQIQIIQNVDNISKQLQNNLQVTQQVGQIIKNGTPDQTSYLLTQQAVIYAKQQVQAMMLPQNTSNHKSEIVQLIVISNQTEKIQRAIDDTVTQLQSLTQPNYIKKANIIKRRKGEQIDRKIQTKIKAAQKFIRTYQKALKQFTIQMPNLHKYPLSMVTEIMSIITQSKIKKAKMQDYMLMIYKELTQLKFSLNVQEDSILIIMGPSIPFILSQSFKILSQAPDYIKVLMERANQINQRNAQLQQLTDNQQSFQTFMQQQTQSIFNHISDSFMKQNNVLDNINTALNDNKLLLSTMGDKLERTISLNTNATIKQIQKSNNSLITQLNRLQNISQQIKQISIQSLNKINQVGRKIEGVMQQVTRIKVQVQKIQTISNDNFKVSNQILSSLKQLTGTLSSKQNQLLSKIFNQVNELKGERLQSIFDRQVQQNESYRKIYQQRSLMNQQFQNIGQQIKAKHQAFLNQNQLLQNSLGNIYGNVSTNLISQTKDLEQLISQTSKKNKQQRDILIDQFQKKQKLRIQQQSKIKGQLQKYKLNLTGILNYITPQSQQKYTKNMAQYTDQIKGTQKSLQQLASKRLSLTTQLTQLQKLHQKKTLTYKQANAKFQKLLGSLDLDTPKQTVINNLPKIFDALNSSFKLVSGVNIGKGQSIVDQLKQINQGIKIIMSASGSSGGGGGQDNKNLAKISQLQSHLKQKSTMIERMTLFLVKMVQLLQQNIRLTLQFNSKFLQRMLQGKKLTKKQAAYVLDDINNNYTNDTKDIIDIVYDKLSGSGVEQQIDNVINKIKSQYQPNKSGVTQYQRVRKKIKDF